MQIYVEVEDNENSYGVPLRTFQVKGTAYPVRQVKMDTRAGLGVPCWVVGWSSEGDGTPQHGVECVAVEDSGAGLSYLVHGGDWGLRFQPVRDDGSPAAPWRLDDPDQFGEPYLLLADESDVIPA